MSVMVEVSEKEIIDNDAFLFVQDDSHGALVAFKGIVRDVNHGKKVVSVSYDAFVPLAKKTLRTIIDEGLTKFDTKFKVAIIHRTGNLKIREVSLLVVVSSKHRDEAYELSRYILEELKVRVPIWKKEFYENGETEWLRGHALCSHKSRSKNHEKDHRVSSCGGEIHSHGNE